MIEPRDRYRGALLGLATGDALGTTLEFRAPGSFKKIDDMVGGGPFQLAPGEWTDDTSMALCLAESLIQTKRFDPVDQLEHYIRWADHAHLSSNGTVFDIGNTVCRALANFRTSRSPHSGPSDEYSAGNGSLMRLAAIPLFFSGSPQAAIEKSGESSRTTHGAPVAVDACRYMGALMIGALNGAAKQELLSDHFSPIPGYWDQNPLVARIAEIAAGSFKHREPPDIAGSGYVVKSLEAALWAFHRSNDFREGCLLAANLGDDADTTSAIYGQLAGAFYGEQAIPLASREKLAHSALITSFADRLLILSEAAARPSLD
jgi:ADP-ribosyl-[dinitrogen reductase] hydrolase